MSKKHLCFAAIMVFFASVYTVFAGGGGEEHSYHSVLLTALYASAFLIPMVKIFEGIVLRFGMPSVLGAILMGLAIRGLDVLPIPALHFADQLLGNEPFKLVADFGAILLLFSVGLESNIQEMSKVGLRAFIVACAGVAVPFVSTTFFLAPMFFPNESIITHIFLGATFVATSVGVTASILKDLGLQDTIAGKTLVAAAVIDDVIGIVILAVVAAMAQGESVGIAGTLKLSLTAFGFLIISVLLGYFTAPAVSNYFSSIHNGTGMRLSLVMGFACLYSALAYSFGLEPILGAFAAGLVLDPVHFKNYDPSPGTARLIEMLSGVHDHHLDKAEELVAESEEHEIEELITSLSHLFVPQFFLATGMQIVLAILTIKTLAIGLVFSLVAVITKMVSGIFSPGSFKEKSIVGAGMVARGEVGLIFAATGLRLNALTEEQFAVVMVVVLATTFVTPLLIKLVARDRSEVSVN